jgi:hypothetical protein
VFYAAGGSAAAPLGVPWNLENYMLSVDQRTWLPRSEPQFRVDRAFDTNGDGTVDQRESVALYDLLLQHSSKDAQLWVRTVPLKPEDASVELSALAHRYTEEAAGTGRVVAAFGEEVASPKEANLAAKTLLERSCSVSKREAFRIDFEMEGKADPQAQRRGSVVLVRTGYQHQLKLAPGQTSNYPVLMLIGMASLAQDFHALEPHFERLLKQTVLGDQFQGLSMNGEHTCGLPEGSGGEAPWERGAP